MRWLPMALCTACIDPSTPGALVPPTADEDPLLPALDLTVAGHDRRMHLRTLGDPDQPTVLFLHGSGSDHRVWLDYEGLTDAYHLVLFDQLGAGLSERITEEEIGFGPSVDAIGVVADTFSPDRPVHLVGHSWGGILAAAYAVEQPDRVASLFLVEPGPLDGEVMQATYQDFFQLSLTESVLNQGQWASGFLGPGDHERMDHAYLLTLQGTLVQYHCDPTDPPDWPIWRAGAFLEATRQRQLRVGGSFDYDAAPGLETLDVPTTVVGTSCSALGTAFQERWHLPRLPASTRFESLSGVGHRVPAEDPGAVESLLWEHLSGD